MGAGATRGGRALPASMQRGCHLAGCVAAPAPARCHPIPPCGKHRAARRPALSHTHLLCLSLQEAPHGASQHRVPAVVSAKGWGVGVRVGVGVGVGVGGGAQPEAVARQAGKHARRHARHTRRQTQWRACMCSWACSRAVSCAPPARRPRRVAGRALSPRRWPSSSSTQSGGPVDGGMVGYGLMFAPEPSGVR